MNPFLDACVEEFAEGRGALHLDSEENIRWMLLEQQCPAAVVPPSTLARNTAELSLLPNPAVSAVGPTSDVLLVFNPDLRLIKTVGARFPESQEAMLAGVVLREKHGMSPVFHKLDATTEEGLARYDAVLVCESGVSLRNPTYSASLDIVDEWFDMTQLPFVRAVGAAWDGLITEDLCGKISRAAAAADTAAVAALRRELEAGAAADAANIIPGHYRFVLDDDSHRGMEEFFRLCFFHGLHSDIPSFRLWSPSGAAKLSPAS